MTRAAVAKQRDTCCGALWIQPGSHRSGVLPHAPTDIVFFRGYEGPETGVPVPKLAGDVLCFSSLMMYRTGASRSASERANA